METIVLDGRCLKERERAHRYLKRKFQFPEYYGNNLDALWDLLTEEVSPLAVTVLYSRALLEEEGYGARILRVLERVGEEREGFTLELH